MSLQLDRTVDNQFKIVIIVNSSLNCPLSTIGTINFQLSAVNYSDRKSFVKVEKPGFLEKPGFSSTVKRSTINCQSIDCQLSFLPVKKTIIGIMGPGESATAKDLENAFQLGQLIAQAGWVLLTGGRNSGVMDAANKGARSANGLTIGILPGNRASGISEAVDIAIITDMGNARNNINILSADAIIACGMGTGTASEISLALKANKQVILLNDCAESKIFFKTLAVDRIFVVNNVSEAIDRTRLILADRT